MNYLVSVLILINEYLGAILHEVPCIKALLQGEVFVDLNTRKL